MKAHRIATQIVMLERRQVGVFDADRLLLAARRHQALER